MPTTLVQNDTASPEAAGESPARRLRDGRLVVLLALVIYGGVLVYPHHTVNTLQWQRTGILMAVLPFADMRSVTSAWECTRQGQPVMVANHCDPLGSRPANYPSVWLRLSSLGLGQGDTTALGIGVGVACLASIFLLAGRLSLVEGVVWSALITSPSVMLGVCRGNVDILLFAFLVVALIALTGKRRLTQAVGCALIELTAILKLFPVFASVAVLHWPRKRALIAFGALAVVFADYAWLISHEIATIRRVVPKDIGLSFGVGVMVDALRNTYGNGALLVHGRTGAIALVAAATLLVASALAAIAARSRDRDTQPSTRLPWFWAGAALMVGTWAFTENSYDYRLIFCLFTVPQLLEWARQSKPAVPFARAALVLLVATLWLSDTQPLLTGITNPWLHLESHFPFDELLVWAVVVYFTAAALLTLPPWLRRRPAVEPQGRRNVHEDAAGYASRASASS